MGSQHGSPVALRVGQVMTGFGVGCGVGVGVGYPIALGSIPLVGDVLSATSNAGSRAFGGVGHKALGMLKKIGIKNLKAGAGCGVGFGHGFGVGKSTDGERLSAAGGQLQRYIPVSRGESEAAGQKLQAVAPPDAVVIGQTLPRKDVEPAPEKSVAYVSRDFSGNSESASSATSRVDTEGQDLRQENEILRTLLRHQELIDELKTQNASILQALSARFDLHISRQQNDTDTTLNEGAAGNNKDEMLHAGHGHSHKRDRACFDCRVAARRRR